MNVDEAMGKWKHLRGLYDMPEWPRTAMDVLIAEVERLRAEVQRLDIAGTHTCHDDCPKLPCVQRREIERLRAELATAKAASAVQPELERQNRDYLFAIAAICQTHGGQIHFTEKAVHEIGRDFKIETWRDLANSRTMIMVQKEQDQTPPAS